MFGLSYLRSGVLIGTVVIYVATLLYALNLRASIAICNGERAIQNYAILQQAKAEEDAKKRLVDAEKAADLHRVESDKSILGLLNEEAPTECCAAIKWGMAHSVP
jgi:hypothetical protein